MGCFVEALATEAVSNHLFLDFPLVSQPIWNKIPPSGSSSSYLSPMEANNLCSQLVSRTRIAPHPAAQMLRCLRFVISKLCSPWNLETNHPSNSWATIKTVPGANKRHQQIIGPTTRRKRNSPKRPQHHFFQTPWPIDPIAKRNGRRLYDPYTPRYGGVVWKWNQMIENVRFRNAAHHLAPVPELVSVEGSRDMT